MAVTRRTVENSYESKIVIGMIMSDHFLKDIIPIYKPEYLKNTFARIVCSWVIEYYEQYEKAPKFHIKDIFEIERARVEEAEEQVIEVFLSKLSKQYTEDQNINEDYFTDKALEYFEEREVEIFRDRINKLTANGKIKEVQSEIANYKKVAKQTSKWYNPFDPKVIQATFEDTIDIVLQMPGKLGEFVGPLERGWLVSIVGRFKVGKSFSMQEMAIQGAIQDAVLSNVKVASISLEMKAKNINKRLYKRITAFADEEGEVQIPVFDCEANQNNACELNQRTNFMGLKINSELPKYNPNSEYRPCTACRKLHSLEQPENYALTSWFTTVVKEKYTLKNTMRNLKDYSEMWGDNFRAISYPRFSATIDDIKRDLDLLEYMEGFIPDLIAVDYLGIIKPSRQFSKDYLALDDMWKQIAGMGEERHALMITGSQVNRGELGKSNIESGGLAGWVGQEGHIDKSFALNQTKDEKVRGLMRWNKLADRHQDFNELETCLVLQKPSIGQTVLDSEIIG